MTTKTKLKILTSHPIQYQVPLFRELISSGLDIDVAYYYKGMAGQRLRDEEFGIDVQWDIDLLSGYPHFFMVDNAQFGVVEQVRIGPKLLLWGLRGRDTPLLLIGWFAEIVWLLWLLRILSNAPILTLSDNTLFSYQAIKRPQWRRKLLKFLLCHSSGHLFVGIRNKEFLTDMGVNPDKLSYIPHSIDNERFSHVAERSDRRSLCYQYGLDPDMPTFLFSGKLIPKKHPLELLKAYLDADLQNVTQLLYVGDGILNSAIAEFVREADLKNVHLLGFFNQSQMPLAYVLGHILCLISDPTETWGLVVNEAFACGRPAIVSEVVGCAPDLVASSTGWIVPVDNYEALVQVLRKAYEQRDLWSQMGHSGQQLVSRHTYAAMVKGIKSALVKI